ncbi:hypothetical protein BDV39DRAFT_151012 [Aspergillus sergii]|uniref:Uncharacterized protein n=1 Tax=Aspergillus sergii TaxID=1034303 RepID=A0A5N6XGE2_9EURO|nr:hypothetical protein BDV39DRAFT_151012 [Aspergillus sergii]
MQARPNVSYKREMKEVYVLLAKNKKRRGKPHVYIPLCPRGPCAIMICAVIAAFFAPFTSYSDIQSADVNFSLSPVFCSFLYYSSRFVPLFLLLSLFVWDRTVA